MDILYLVTGYKKFFDQKELQIEMSSLFNGSSKPEEFSPNEVEVLVDNKGQDWFKRAHVEIYLG